MTWLGHGAAERSFLDAWNGGRMHHAWLLSGPRGLGKAAFAARAARFLLARQTAPGDGEAVSLDDEGDAATRQLIEAGAHPEFRLLTRLENEKTGVPARNITVDQVRSACATLGWTTAISRYRTIIVDSADDLEAAGANALLKSLEEPPPDTVFFLVSHNSGRLLPTIRSRCRSLVFRALDDDVMTSWLRAASPEADAATIAAQRALAAGSPGRAARLRGADLAPLWRDLETLVRDGDDDLVIASRLAQSLSLKAANDGYEVFLELAPAMLHKSALSLASDDPAALVERWRTASELARSAVGSSADKASTVFELCCLIAGEPSTRTLSNDSAAR